MDYLLLLFCVLKYKTIGHHFGFHGLRFLKPSYVSIVALLPRPEGVGDSLYRFISKIKIKEEMSKPFPAIPTKLYLPPSALPVTSLTRFSVAFQQPSPSSVGILFDPLSSHNTTCFFREFLKCFPRDSNGWFPVSHKYVTPVMSRKSVSLAERIYQYSGAVISTYTTIIRINLR